MAQSYGPSLFSRCASVGYPWARLGPSVGLRARVVGLPGPFWATGTEKLRSLYELFSPNSAGSSTAPALRACSGSFGDLSSNRQWGPRQDATQEVLEVLEARLFRSETDFWRAVRDRQWGPRQDATQEV